MIGYKTITQFSYDDCIHHIENCKQKGVKPVTEVEKLFFSLLKELQLKDDALFNANKTSIRGCKKYIKSFPIADAKSYKARHLDEAKLIVDKLERKSRQIRKRCFLFFAVVVFSIFTIWGWLSYKPLPNLSFQDKIEVSQYGDTILLSNYLHGTDNRTKIYIDNNHDIEADESLGYNIYRNDAHDYYDIGPTQSSDYIDLSWENRIYIHKKYVIPMNCSQDVIKKRIRIESYSEIFGLKIKHKTDYINIHQHGGGATFMFVSEWYKPKFYANGRINVDVNNNGIRGNSYPVFLDTDGTYVNVQFSDPWITVEKREDVEGDNYNFHIRVEENRTSGKRIGTVKFSSGDKYIEYVLSQAKGYATYFETEEDEVYLRPDEVWTEGDLAPYAFIDGHCYSVKIITDGIWDYKLDNDYDWIKLNKRALSDDNRIQFQVRENTGGERNASIIISTLNKGTKTISVTQYGVYE